MGKRIQLAGAPARLRKIPYGEGQDVTTRARDAGRTATSRRCGAQRLFG